MTELNTMVHNVSHVVWTQQWNGNAVWTDLTFYDAEGSPLYTVTAFGDGKSPTVEEGHHDQ